MIKGSSVQGFRWGIEGLLGSIPRGSTVVLAGEVGKGLAILSQGFVEDGLTEGNLVIYSSCSRSLNQFRLECQSQVCLDGLAAGSLHYLDFTSPTLTLNDYSHKVIETIQSLDRPARLVLESLGILALKFGPENVLKWLLAVKPRIARSNVVALMILELGMHPHGFENAAKALSECVVETSNTEDKGVSTSRYRVLVCKGIRFENKWYSLG